MPPFLTRLRALVVAVFVLVHAGMLLGVIGVARLSMTTPFDGNLISITTGFGLVYLGVFVGTFFLVWPLIPYVKKAQEVRAWWQHLLADFPQIVELMKQAMETLKPYWKKFEP